MDDLYKDIILEHYRNPYHRGRLEDADISANDENPLCGDELTLSLKIDEKDKKIIDCRFDGHGCSISQAAADILCENIIGKDIKEVLAMTKEDMLDLLGIELGPVRIKCGLLALKVAKVAGYKYIGKDVEQEKKDKDM